MCCLTPVSLSAVLRGALRFRKQDSDLVTFRGRLGQLEGLLRVREREMERLGRVMEQVRVRVYTS